MNYIKLYVDEIESGNIVAPKRVIKVYKDILKSIEDGKYYYDDKAAEDFIYFNENYLKHSKAPFTGKPLKLALFQKAKACAIYGVKKEDGKRRFREVFDYRARKNGKTTELAGASLYHLIGDKEGGAEVYSVATKLDQAKRVFTEASNMVRQSKALSKVIRKRQSDLYFPFNFSIMKALASDSNTLDGLNSSFICIDEMHAIKDWQLYEVLQKSTSAREQPLIETITTAGMIREGIFDDRYKYACDVADGIIEDETFLPILYELDDRNEWKNPNMWIKANPGLHEIKRYDYLYNQVERAKNNPSELRGLLCYEFNIIETSNSSWLSLDAIVNKATFEIDDLYNTYAIGGCDLSATTDLTCATLLIKKPNDETLYCLQKYFLPETRIRYLEKTVSKEAPYKVWADRGLIKICEGTMVNYSDVTEWFVEMSEKYKIDLFKLGYDRALAGYWVEEMKGYFGEYAMEKVAQGAFTWTGPMKELGAMLEDKKINYNNNPILAWCLANTGAKISGTVESIQPVKIQENRRIDGMVSLLNAFVIYTKYRDDYLNMIGE